MFDVKRSPKIRQCDIAPFLRNARFRSLEDASVRPTVSVGVDPVQDGDPADLVVHLELAEALHVHLLSNHERHVICHLIRRGRQVIEL